MTLFSTLSGFLLYRPFAALLIGEAGVRDASGTRHFERLTSLIPLAQAALPLQNYRPGRS